MKNTKFWSALMMGSALLAASSCVDADIDDALDYKNAYSNSDDADKAILGVYSEFMALAKQMVVLNELRGDLLDITGNADTYLQEVDAMKIDAANPYMDPTAYYTVIANCNDCLDNFDKMLARHDMDEDQYNERYSDIAALRCYVYLQLGAQFGTVPYVTSPIVTVDEMKQQKGVEMLDLPSLIGRLITCMESLPYMEPYEESPLVYNDVTGSATTVANQRLSYYFVPKKLLLADLYLWNNQYYEAAAGYKELLDYSSALDDSNNHQYYKCCSSSTAGTASAVSPYYQAYFLRFHDADDNSFGTTWPEMFGDELTTKSASYEWVWAMTFPAAASQTYPFVDLFASASDGGSYLLKPSSACMTNFNRLDYLRVNDAPYDTRGAGATYSVSTSGDTLCAKYLHLFDVTTPYKKEGRLWLYRAAMIQLRFAEAINRYGYPDLALAFVNNGLTGAYGTSYPSGTTRTTDPTTFKGKHTIFDLLKPITMGLCTTPQDSALLFFDTRFYTTASSNPYDGYARRGPWRYHAGLRVGRACMTAKSASDFSTRTLADCATKADTIYLVEKIIMDEAALELAHEGNRFPDLVRVAHRMNVAGNDGMSGDEYFRAVMDRKYNSGKNALGKPDYSGGESSWFLPYR